MTAPKSSGTSEAFDSNSKWSERSQDVSLVPIRKNTAESGEPSFAMPRLGLCRSSSGLLGFGRGGRGLQGILQNPFSPSFYLVSFPDPLPPAYSTPLRFFLVSLHSLSLWLSLSLSLFPFSLGPRSGAAFDPGSPN